MYPRALINTIIIGAGIAFLLFVPGSDAYAQLQVWRHINTAEMANTNTNVITEGPTGFMYFGTQEGLLQFDGRRFHMIEVPDRKSKGLDIFTHMLKWGRHSRLWVATRFYVYSYDPATGIARSEYSMATQPIKHMEVDSVTNMLYVIHADTLTAFNILDSGLQVKFNVPVTQITRLLVTKNNELFALRNNEEILRIREGAAELFFKAPIIKDFNYVLTRHSFVMLTNEGLQKLNLETRQASALRPQKKWNLQSPKTRIMTLNNGQTLIQSAETIFLLNALEDTNLTNYAPDIRNPWSVKSNFLNTAYSDHRNNLWAAEDGVGISVLPSNARQVQYLPGTMIGAARLWKPYHDSLHKQVFATSENGLCVIHYESDTVSYQANVKPPGSRLFEVMDYIPWAKDELLLITNGQGSWLFNTVYYRFKPFEPLNKALGHTSFWGARLIKPGSYLLHGANGMFLFDKTKLKTKGLKTVENSIKGVAFNELGKSEILAVYADGKGHTWLGTGFGIEILDSNFNILKKFGGSTSGNSDGLGSNAILDIKAGPDGKIYVATSGGGAFQYNGNDKFTPVPLAGNPAITYCILAIDAANVLISTSKGLCLYNTQNKRSWLISEQSGLPITDFNQFALVGDDRLILGAGAKGVVLMNKKRLFANFHDTAQMQVMSGLCAISNLVLAKGKHSIDLDIAITGFASNTVWNIEYTLEGLDDGWKPMTKGEWHIRYNSIQPGGYILKVRATDENGVVWVNQVEVTITAIPFFWQTVWFRGIMLCLGLGLIIIVVRFLSRMSLKWRLEKLEDEQKISRERLRIARELHDNVGSQLTYLITGLESTEMLLKKQETEKLSNKIDKMQTSARESMQQLRDAIWALNSESVAATVLYARFETWLNKIMDAFPGIEVSLQKDITTDTLLDPVKSLNIFRILQEAVHNVVKHAHATALNISYNCDSMQLSIRVQDNGNGTDAAMKDGNGMRAMKARANEMGGSIQIDSAPGNGTTVSLFVDIK